MTTKEHLPFLLTYKGIKYVVKVLGGIINLDEEYILSPVEELRGIKPIRVAGNEIQQRELIVPYKN